MYVCITHSKVYLVSDSSGRSHHEFVQFHTQTDLEKNFMSEMRPSFRIIPHLSIFLGQIFEFHTWRSLHSKPLRNKELVCVAVQLSSYE